MRVPFGSVLSCESQIVTVFVPSVIVKWRVNLELLTATFADTKVRAATAAVFVIDDLMPSRAAVLAELSVRSTATLPATVPVCAKSSKVPVVEPVSALVEEMRTRELPAPKTEVVCATKRAVEVPATSALLTILTTSPVVVFTPVTSTAAPEPVVLEAVTASTAPVKPVVTPVWVKLKREPVVAPVLEEETATAVPVVSALATIRTTPVAVVAPEAVTASRSPVVTRVPEEVIVTACPEVRPLAVIRNTVPIVALLAVNFTTPVPVKTPVLVTVKAVAEVELEVMSPRATTAEPPIVVLAGSVTVALSPKVMSLLVRKPLYFVTGIKSSCNPPARSAIILSFNPLL